MWKIVESFTDKRGVRWFNMVDTETDERSHAGTRWRRADESTDKKLGK